MVTTLTTLAFCQVASAIAPPRANLLPPANLDLHHLLCLHNLITARLSWIHLHHPCYLLHRLHHPNLACVQTIWAEPSLPVVLPKVCIAVMSFHGMSAHTMFSATPASGDHDRPQMVTISVPLNTTIVGGLVTRRELRIPSDIIFADFYSRMCANMDLNPDEALIGYKFHTDRAKDAPRQLSNEAEYLAMMQEMIRRILAARTRNPVLFLHNLVRPYVLGQKHHYSHTALAQRPATHTPVSKRKRDDEPADSKECRPRPSTTLDFTCEYRELQSRLRCRLHGSRPCRVDPITADHHELNIYQLTLWARMIVRPAWKFQIWAMLTTI